MNTQLMPGTTIMTLTSPIGAATHRHFYISAGNNQNWSVSAIPANANVQLTSAVGVLRLVIPQNYAGKITLTVGIQSFTINVVANRLRSTDVLVGETFAGGNTEWRILVKNGNQALIISEHVLFQDRINPSDRGWVNPNWDIVGNWHNSMLRGDLNTLYIPYNPTRPAESWIGPISTQYTTIKTKLGFNGPQYYELHNQWWFLLSEDEVFGGSSGGNTANNLFPEKTLFADNASRSATYLSQYPMQIWWLRSPRGSGDRFAAVNSNGTVNDFVYSTLQGIRPACVIGLND